MNKELIQNLQEKHFYSSWIEVSLYTQKMQKRQVLFYSKTIAEAKKNIINHKFNF
jgi:hypothetical protein